MNPDRELVDPAQVGTALAVLSIVALVVSGALLTLARKPGSSSRRRGGLIAAGLVLAWPMWMGYNAIEDRFGLDSVAALLVNLGLFLAVGTVLGAVFRRFWPAGAREDDETAGAVSAREAEGASPALLKE